MNTTIFTGRITHTPELKTTQNGKSVCSFSIAVERGWGDNKKASFPVLIAWNGQAEFVAKLPKGTMIVARAAYDERKWEDKNGQKRKSHEFIVEEIQSLEPKRTETQEDYNCDKSDIEEIHDDMPF